MAQDADQSNRNRSRLVSYAYGVSKSLLPESIDRYIEATFVNEAPGLGDLRMETATMERASMQITAQQGVLLSMLVKLIDARNTLEIGIFTGYSSLAVLLATPPDAHHVALDISQETTRTALRHWEKAGVAAKAEVMIGPANESLDLLLARNSSFDFCFIDADKPNYPRYFEKAVRLVRSNGLIVIDNTLWSGRVADPEDQSEETVCIRRVNQMVAADPRVEACMIPAGDGLLVARKL